MASPAAARETLLMSTPLELPLPGRATYADLEALPERYLGELIGGTLHAKARPALPHALAASALGAFLFGAFNRRQGEEGGPPGGWWILDEPELHFGSDVLVPDIAGWRRERLPQIPAEPWMELAPDWVCEVSSPATWQLDRTVKLDTYFTQGVGHVWFVEPSTRRIEVLRHTAEGWLLVANHFHEEVVGIEPFAGVPLALEALWVSKEG